MTEKTENNRKYSPLKKSQAILSLGLTVGFLLIACGIILGLMAVQGSNLTHQVFLAIGHWWWSFLLFAVFGIGLLAFFLAQLFLLPVKRITKVMGAFEEDPMTKKRVDVSAYNQELDELGQLLNQTMGQVQNLVQSQQDFVSDVSHELRTPVTIVKGHLNLLARWGKDDPEVLADSLSSSLSEIKRMEVLVNEMLQLTRAEKLIVNKEQITTSVAAVVERVYHDFQIVHPEFSWTYDGEVSQPIEVAIRPDHLEQLLIILLDNAIKYSTDRKEVHLALAKAGAWVEIGVQDFGQGIAHDDLDRIFDRFYRVDKARVHQPGGNGLGLSIVKKMVAAYGGQVQVESALGSGSSFRLRFPLVDPSQEEVLEEKQSDLTDS
ncbi:GHKL domain-containing protein [Fructobacillus sp. M1-13]|uniref:histidine kinase n=1 Tax=Fructobacillus papyriferae TaxID=2713171 RepID=A0ABS5QSG6_9LACO|nr:HAMP domain-containing sensor histidine kinase [Fructobacillus papyriferae]MBS9335420.1 HAMP domain-containing histidine kinase [Fructobacillus papyriferae]MCD2158910.1 GHKL domain-containing protein [Fructobacillus papyriferae]